MINEGLFLIRLHFILRYFFGNSGKNECRKEKAKKPKRQSWTISGAGGGGGVPPDAKWVAFESSAPLRAKLSATAWQSGPGSADWPVNLFFFFSGLRCFFESVVVFFYGFRRTNLLLAINSFFFVLFLFFGFRRVSP